MAQCDLIFEKANSVQRANLLLQTQKDHLIPIELALQKPCTIIKIQNTADNIRLNYIDTIKHLFRKTNKLKEDATLTTHRCHQIQQLVNNVEIQLKKTLKSLGTVLELTILSKWLDKKIGKATKNSISEK